MGYFLNTNQHISKANAAIPPKAGQKGMSFPKVTRSLINPPDFEANSPYSII